MAADEVMRAFIARGIEQGLNPLEVQELQDIQRRLHQMFPDNPTLEALGIRRGSEDIIPLEPARLAQETSRWFTDGALRVFKAAEAESRNLNHDYVGTEHLLLGVLKAPEIDPYLPEDDRKRIDSAVRFIVGRGERVVLDQPGLTPRAKTVVTLSAREANIQHFPQINPAAMLLGLLREGDGIAAGVLESLGYSLDTLRDQVAKHSPKTS